MNMRKDHLLPGLALVGGLLGFALRRWQWAAGWDPQALLFISGHPAGLLLLLLAGMTSLAVIALTRDLRAPAEEPPFPCPHSGWLAGTTAGALLFAISAPLFLLEGMSQMALCRAAPDSHPITYPIALMLCGVLALLSAIDRLMLGRASFRSRRDPILSLTALAPPAAALTWVFACHMAHATDPILWNYGPMLAAAILLQLAHYEQAAAFHRGTHPRVWAFFALTGSFFGLLSFRDGGTLAQTVFQAALILSALTGLWPLLRACWGPAWPVREERMPSGAQDEDDDDDTLDF